MPSFIIYEKPGTTFWLLGMQQLQSAAVIIGRIIISSLKWYQNYLMSNIRDLQKLKDTRKMQELGLLNKRVFNPERSTFNYDSISIKNPLQFNFNKNSQPQPEERLLSRGFALHRRGSSFGMPQVAERFTASIMQNPKFSGYSLPFKQAEVQTDRKQLRFQSPQPAKTERKIKNNYVNCNEFSLPKRDLAIVDPKNLTIGANDSQALNKSEYNMLLAVGKGGFGKVWKVQAKRDHQIYAMKEMSKAKIISKKSVASVLNERRFLSQLTHPFLVNMTTAFQDRQNLYLVLDYLDGGDLRYHLGNRQHFHEKQCKFFIANVVIALQYLHRNKIIHRDLKPENLVFDSQGFLKLTDLGISRELREDNRQDTSGTPGYMSPEVMVRRPHTFTADYYALGVIAYELMLGRRPYVGNRKEIKQQILARQVAVKFDQLPFKWSPYALDFVNRLILRNPAQRLGAAGIQEIKEHPWLSGVEWDKIISRKVTPPFKPLRIEDDYQNYKQQISQDTVVENQEQILLMLRQAQTKELFEDYRFYKNEAGRKNISYPTTSTEDNFGRR